MLATSRLADLAQQGYKTQLMIMPLTLEAQLGLFLRVLAGAVLCALIGVERERHGHAAGLRTHMLVGLGAALFTALSFYAFPGSDTARVAAQVVSGIGFLGAGAILQRRDRYHMHGLTTAASIWASAAIGMACGAALYVIAALTALLVVVVLAVLAPLGERLRPVPKAETTEGVPYP
ncbi:MAG: MgtC/SapB family protein [Thermoflexales bacterium]|nr:MgtC/SapB family protein [Thermoflexales bacterium]MDW8292687.1 MgtC/SapB family protein [Anaerolineae bacterium]